MMPMTWNDSVADGHMAVDFGAEKLRGTLSEHNVVGVLRKVRGYRPNPRCLADARVGGGYAKAGDDGMIGAGDDPEQHRVGMEKPWASSAICSSAAAGTLLKNRSETLRSKTIISLSLDSMPENMPMAP